MKKSEIIFGVLRLPIDFLVTMGAFWLAYTIRPFTDLIPGVHFEFLPEMLPSIPEYFWFSLGASAFLVFLFVINSLYSLKSTDSFGKAIFKVGFLVSAWLMFIISYYFLVVHQLFFSRISLAHIWFFTLVFITFGRVLIFSLQSFLLRFDIGKRKVLFIGANDLADQCYCFLQKDPHYEVIGALSDTQYSRKKGCIKIIGTLSSLKQIIKKYHIDEIIQSEQDIRNTEAGDLLAFCRSRQIRYRFIPDLLRLQRTHVNIEMLDDVPLISLQQTPLEGWGHVYKRIFDIVFSSILIILLIPIWIIVPILIKIDSKGPIFFKSKRKYRYQVFNIFKFRSMIIDADGKKKELLTQNERSGPLFKIKNDPRITRLGRFLRKTSIDELPQLFNVLFGTVSLVGPRPHLPEEVEQYKQHHYEVFAIKPGVTGLAQVSGRSNLDFEEEVKLDVFYIENWSVFMDVKLILKSILVVLRADGH